MFSDSTEARLSAPRPPEPMIARFSLSLRLRPRTIAGAESEMMPAAAVWLRNCRRDKPLLVLFSLRVFLGIMKSPSVSFLKSLSRKWYSFGWTDTLYGSSGFGQGSRPEFQFEEIG